MSFDHLWDTVCRDLAYQPRTKMTLPIFPIEAQPVLDIIRRDVKRPRRLPKFYETQFSEVLRWETDDGANYCPMGMHPKASVESPLVPSEFCGYSNVNGDRLRCAVKHFYEWFDSIEPTKANARAVQDFIWPRKL